MANAIPIFFEILACFLLSTTLLHRYSDMVNNNIVTVVGVFISWFFSFMVIFLLPADITSTAYNQCLLDYQPSINTSTTPSPIMNIQNIHNNMTTPSTLTLLNSASIPQHLLFSNQSAITVDSLDPVPSSNSTSNNTILVNPCISPWNYVPESVLTKLWRFIYWTSQILTWLVLPIMQSYSMTGDFTTLERLKSAIRANLIYYSSIGAIFTVLLIYVMFKNGIDFANLKVIAISSSNTWGLFLLVVLLGYGLVGLPRSLIEHGRHFQSLDKHYFRVGKLNAEKIEAEGKLDDVLEEIYQVHTAIGTNEHNPLRIYLAKIVDKCPPDWKHRSNVFRRQATASNSSYESDRFKTQDYDLQTLIRLHRKVIKAVHYHRQITHRWNHLINEVIGLEDTARNYLDYRGTSSSSKIFKSTLPRERSLIHVFYNAKVEWYWKCVIRIWLFRIIGLVAASLSIAVVWSEIAFPFVAFAPRLSIFAYIVDNLQTSQDYFYLELFSIVSIGYLAICAFYTVFHMKIYNVYYLASNKQTDEYSLSFSGMLVCRLAAPLCLNYLCLVNRDSHFIKRTSTSLETSFTTIMGHLDLIPIVNSGLNIFLPLCIGAICMAVYFDFKTWILHSLGYEQFIENDDMSADLAHTGNGLIEREKSKLLRSCESTNGAYHEMVTGCVRSAPIVTTS